MTINKANRRTVGISTYYVESESRPGVRHVVTHVRRAGMNRWTCSCPDFLYRGQTKGSHRFCKHLRAVTEKAA